MLRRLAAITFIFFCTAVAWVILGGTISFRTQNSTEHLRGRVQSLWGSPQQQATPFAEYSVLIQEPETIVENGKSRTIERTRSQTHVVRPVATNIAVDLQSEPRQKGLLWYATYKVAFLGAYEFVNPEQDKQNMRLCLRFPAEQAIYDDVQFLVDGTAISPVTDKATACASVDVPAGQQVRFQTSYKSQGLDSWTYSFGKDVNPVQNFHLRMTTNFKDVDFPDSTLAPTTKQMAAKGWQLDWSYKNLLSGYEIAVSMPEKLRLQARSASLLRYRCSFLSLSFSSS